MIHGGFLQVIKAGDKDKKTVIRTIHELLLYKDLVSKYEKNDYLFRLIISKLAQNIGKALYGNHRKSTVGTDHIQQVLIDNLNFFSVTTNDAVIFKFGQYAAYTFTPGINQIPEIFLVDRYGEAIRKIDTIRKFQEDIRYPPSHLLLSSVGTTGEHFQFIPA